MYTGTRLTTAIHRRLLSRFFLREGDVCTQAIKAREVWMWCRSPLQKVLEFFFSLALNSACHESDPYWNARKSVFHSRESNGLKRSQFCLLNKVELHEHCTVDHYNRKIWPNSFKIWVNRFSTRMASTRRWAFAVFLPVMVLFF